MNRKFGGELVTGALVSIILREGWMQIPEETRVLMCSIMVCLGPVGVGLFFAIANNAKWMRSGKD